MAEREFAVEVEVQRTCGPKDDAVDGWLCRPWDCSRPADCPLTGLDPSVERDDIITGADRLQALIRETGDAETCGFACACHGNIACLLREGHAHEVDDRHPHVGVDGDGNLVQWEHVEELHGPVLDAAQVAESTAAAKRAHTYAMLDGLDLDVLREITQSRATVVQDGSAKN